MVCFLGWIVLFVDMLYFCSWSSLAMLYVVNPRQEGASTYLNALIDAQHKTNHLLQLENLPDLDYANRSFLFAAITAQVPYHLEKQVLECCSFWPSPTQSLDCCLRHTTCHLLAGPCLFFTITFFSLNAHHLGILTHEPSAITGCRRRGNTNPMAI